MVNPRISAGIIVILLIGVLSLAGVILVTWAGPILAHGNDVSHVNGKVTAIAPNGASFTLKTANGPMQFQCTEKCPTQLSHMQRHLTEKANTDVYYIQDAANTLTAIDVD